jgi:anthranilate phosphoribosyltransferase
MSKLSWPALIGTLLSGESLTEDATAWAMNEIMDGAASPAQIAGFGVALRAKGESAPEMAGLASAMLARATPLTLPGRVTDLVGTGGDGLHTVNISTMATIVAAATGVKMAKHGNRAASSACGAADVLEALGVVIDLSPSATAAAFEETGIAFLFAALYHPSYRHASVPRREIGVPTAFNYLGPLTNPARPAATAAGVADPRMGPVLAEVLAGRGSSALVFHGGGMDELTTTGSSSVWVVSAGEVTQTTLDPAALDLAPATVEQLRGGDAAFNAAVVRDMLAGRTGPVRDIVLLNAAAAIAADGGLAGPLDDALRAGLDRAATAVDSGAAAALLDRWVEVSQSVLESADCYICWSARNTVSANPVTFSVHSLSCWADSADPDTPITSRVDRSRCQRRSRSRLCSTSSRLASVNLPCDISVSMPATNLPHSARNSAHSA